MIQAMANGKIETTEIKVLLQKAGLLSYEVFKSGQLKKYLNADR